MESLAPLSGPAPNNALGSNPEPGGRAPRDAFIYGRWDLAGHLLDARAGRQVVNWGESTFIPGINGAINHFDVAALRVPGSELREAYLPQEILKLAFGVTGDFDTAPDVDVLARSIADGITELVGRVGTTIDLVELEQTAPTHASTSSQKPPSA